MKLRTAIFGVYVAASAVGFAVLMRFMLAEVRPRYVSAVRQNLQDSARIVAAALAGRSVAEAKAALKSPVAFRVRLIAADGTVLVDSAEPAAPAEDYEESSDVSLAKRAGIRLIDGAALQHALEVSVVEPIRQVDGTVTRLVLSRSFRSLNGVIWYERKKLAAIALVVAGVMVVAGWWLTARLTHSLERLTAYVRGVRDARIVSPPRSRVVEISGLALAFEEMRDALEGRQHVERYTQALAHEVKAPLAAIRGAAELLDEPMPEEQRARFLANIRGETARIQQIVERLLELSSLEARKALQQAETVGAGELMNEAADAVRSAYASGKVTLTLAPCAAQVRGERVLLREALVNLLQNALEFSAAGGRVHFAATADAGHVTWSVDDHGAGVPNYALTRAFERFYSLPRPGTERRSTGIGLALVREIALLHGGDASLANRPEGGARATLRVPILSGKIA